MPDFKDCSINLLNYEEQAHLMIIMSEWMKGNCKIETERIIDADGKEKYIHTIKFPKAVNA